MAWHHDCFVSCETEPASTEQHWMGVLKVLFCAATKPAKAEAAAMMLEERIVVDGAKYQCLWSSSVSGRSAVEAHGGGAARPG